MQFGKAQIEWLDTTLQDVAEKIQLTPTAYDLAVDRYNRIAHYLSSATSQFADFSPIIYPQGSFRVQSTIANHDKDEDYDIDLILEANINRAEDPDLVLDKLKQVMDRGKGTLKFQNCEKKRRCVTVQYSGMHLDITPAMLIDPNNPRVIQIFDCHPKRDNWPIANPEGFARWFEDQLYPRTIVAKRNLRAETHPVPDQKAIERKADRLLSVQLLKRFRDITCDKNNYERCPSVLLTKLAADAPIYDNQGLYADLRAAAVHVGNAVLIEPLSVANPRCSQDMLSDRWPGQSNVNRQFARDLSSLVGKLDLLAGQGTQKEKQTILNELFGERATQAAFETMLKRMSDISHGGTASILKGTSSISIGQGGRAAQIIPSHKFYGKI
jgi:hypothetical protein